MNYLSKINSLIKSEVKRQKDSLVMIPSENYASPAVFAAMGSALSNKYSEGYPHKRYYTGNQYIDQLESLARDLALKIFKLNPKDWHANVQPHSGSGANMAVYMALLNPGDKILGMDLGAGGHLTHGSRVNFSGKLYKFSYYSVNPKTHLLDYKEIARVAKKEKPRLIVCGATAYTQKIDFAKFAKVAKSVGAYLVADIAHIAGLIVGGVHPSPFPYADAVTMTTHKTLRGPRGAIIICKEKLGSDIDKAVFPGIQGGPLENVIAAKAVCFAQALAPKFKQDQKQTVKNAKLLASTLSRNGIKLIADGTENHLLLVDCRNLQISGKEGANLLAEAGIYTNANMIPFDPATPLNPSGIRLGTPALTTRGMKDKEMKLIGLWIAEILKQPKNKKLRTRIKKELKELTRKFPIY